MHSEVEFRDGSLILAAFRSSAASLLFVGQCCTFTSALPLVAASKNSNKPNTLTKLYAYKRAEEVGN